MQEKEENNNIIEEFAKNIDKAKTFYDRACYFKSEKGCQKYKSLSKDK